VIGESGGDCVWRGSRRSVGSSFHRQGAAYWKERLVILRVDRAQVDANSSNLSQRLKLAKLTADRVLTEYYKYLNEYYNTVGCLPHLSHSVTYCHASYCTTWLYRYSIKTATQADTNNTMSSWLQVLWQGCQVGNKRKPYFIKRDHFIFDYNWHFLVDFYNSCTNGNRNEYSTVTCNLFDDVINHDSLTLVYMLKLTIFSLTINFW